MKPSLRERLRRFFYPTSGEQKTETVRELKRRDPDFDPHRYPWSQRQRAERATADALRGVADSLRRIDAIALEYAALDEQTRERIHDAITQCLAALEPVTRESRS